MPGRPLRIGVAAVLSWAVLVSTAIASTAVVSTAEAQDLTLARALALADASYEAPAIARAQVARARAARRRVYADLLPTLSLSGTYRRRAREVVREVSGTSVVVQRHDAFAGLASADLTLLDPTIFPRIVAASHAVDAAELEAENVRRLLWLDVAEAFFTVLASVEVLDAARERVNVADIEARAAAARLEAGLVNRNEVTRADLELGSARLELLRAENALLQARLGLGFLMGANPARTLVAPEGPIVEELPARALVRDAIAIRADLRARRARVSEASALEYEPWLRIAPRVDASADATITNESGLSGNETDWTLAITASWIVYDGGVRYADAAERSADLEALRLEAGALERQIALDVRLALADLSTSTAGVALAEERVRAADLNIDEVRQRFERGLVDALVMADATEQRYIASADLAGQRLSLRLAELDLLRATGRWPGDGP
jgi:outer membrane protein TolC